MPWGLLGVRDLRPFGAHLGSLLFGAHWDPFGAHFLFVWGPFYLGPIWALFWPSLLSPLGGLLVWSWMHELPKPISSRLLLVNAETLWSVGHFFSPSCKKGRE